MTEPFRIALAQLDLLVGDIDGNATRVISVAQQARARLNPDLLLFPELTLSGYPPEDLLFHRGFRRQIEAGLEKVRREVAAPVMIGFPEYTNAGIYNSAALIANGSITAIHRKSELPNYKVFDEKRYFEAGAQPTVVETKGFRVGLLVCEDLWTPEATQMSRAGGAELLVAINASPFEIHKQREREEVARARVLDAGVPLAYVNMVGGQDELVFDGNSFVMNAEGVVVMRAPAFREGTYAVDFVRESHGGIVPQAAVIEPELSDEASVYGALVLGVRDYVNKHGFPGVVMGLSGGVDSALTLAIAVDALGSERVHAVMMPSRYTSSMSLEDAKEQARLLAVKYSMLSIENLFETTLATLENEFSGRPPDASEENIQSRCRMLLLMGISNKTGKMLLTTGNKSEMAVGYATLYGDMAGGFAPIKDCSKMLVYRLATYRNSLGRVIPQRIIDRPPSAELRPDQKDSDSLPSYEVLDAILESFIEEDLSVDEIEARGFDRATVGRVLDLVKRNEYKRRQAPPGVRVSRRAFGRDWRYPITNGYRR
jgi:NAD+ synthase (glutamine-hydrolysing)